MRTTRVAPQESLGSRILQVSDAAPAVRAPTTEPTQPPTPPLAPGVERRAPPAGARSGALSQLAARAWSPAAPTTDASAAPGGATPVPPDRPGPYAVEVKSVLLERDGRSIRLIVDVPVGCEDAPAVVFLPGFKIDAGRYAETGRYLASHGFVVARAGLEGTIFSADHGEMARDASRILDWLGSEESARQIPGRVDPSAMGIAGHSLGGKLATMAAIADPRIKGVFAIDPVNQRQPDLLGPGGPIEQLTVPLGLIGQTRDTRRGAAPKVVTPEGANYTAFLDRAVNAKSAFAVTIRGADHFGFLDQWAPIELATPGRFTQNRPQVLQETRTLMTSFFRLHLKGEALDPRAYADPQRLIQR